MKMLTAFIYKILLVAIVPSVANAAIHGHRHLASNHNHHGGAEVVTTLSDDDVANYLMEFDYLPKSDLETGALRTEEQFIDAIKSLQSFGNIPVTGVIDTATAKLVTTPRCGVGDSNRAFNFSPDNLEHERRKRYVLQGPKWDKTDLTWSLVNQTMSEASQIRQHITSALRVWERNSKLTFREVYSDQADIQVLFARLDHGDGYKFDGPGQVLAHAFYPGGGRGGDAHFDADEIWEFDPTAEKKKGTDFLNVAIHELGHSLGLGHSTDKQAIMYPWYQAQNVDGTLPNDDRYAIQDLYGAREKTWGVYLPKTTTTTTTSRPLVYYPEIRPQPRPQYPKYKPNYQPNYQPNYNPSHYPMRPAITTTTTTTTTTRRPHNTYPTARHRPTKHNKPRKSKPDTCMTTYDAISMIRGELFIFRGQFLWRVGQNGLYKGYPTETRRHWAELPEDLVKVDAVFENRARQIVFFVGRYYYVFDSVILAPGYPQPLTTLGLPATLTHIDAAFVWGHNNRTYLTSGTLYWRMDDDNRRVEYDYPRDMSIWAGVGYNIDAAFKYTDGKTYFFKGHNYWQFNDDRMKVAHPQPRPSARKWLNCPRSPNEVDEEQSSTSSLISGERVHSAKHTNNKYINTNNSAIHKPNNFALTLTIAAIISTLCTLTTRIRCELG